MTVTVTITAGADTGPFFDLYSDVGGYASPIATNVAKATLVAGTNITAPTGSTVIRVKSIGTCTNYVDLQIVGTSTTTTTTTTSTTTTSTTTTTAQPTYAYFINYAENSGATNAASACGPTATGQVWSTRSNINDITNNDVLYSSANMSSVFNGNLKWYGLAASYGATPVKTVQPTTSGVISTTGTCAVTCNNISLSYNQTSWQQACIEYNQSQPIYQLAGIDTTNFADATILYRSCSIQTIRSAGYYSNGVITRYWNGTAFTTQFDCDQ
jgi:hypothetical protein